MIQELAASLADLKKEFQRVYDGKSHIQEAVPTEPEQFSISKQDLALLHEFAKTNPIYYNSYEMNIGGIDCIIYEGDINRYWLSSINCNSSRAPFSPTWIMSAYVLALACKDLGFSEVVDVGSGDGRIAFCAKVLGMNSASIEIDCTLVEMQKQMSAILDFKPYCHDAASFDYKSLDLGLPVFMIGGIAQMGGTDLAASLLKKISSDSVCDRHGWVFTGTYSQKYMRDPKNEAGWGTLIAENSLNVAYTISLPTIWTFREPDQTPYVFAMSG